MRLLLFYIKLYIGITEAITKLAATATPLVAAPTPVQHVAQVLVRQGVTFPSPGAHRLLGRRVEPLVDVVTGWGWLAQGQTLGSPAATATRRRGRAADSLGASQEVQSLVGLELKDKILISQAFFLTNYKRH